MPDIGIIGGGVGGTHLGLFLRQRGVSATIYTGSINNPDRFWHIASRPDRVEVITKHLIAGTLSAKPLEWDAIAALANAEAATR